MKMLVHVETDRVVGVHMVGPYGAFVRCAVQPAQPHTPTPAHAHAHIHTYHL